MEEFYSTIQDESGIITLRFSKVHTSVSIKYFVQMIFASGHPVFFEMHFQDQLWVVIPPIPIAIEPYTTRLHELISQYPHLLANEGDH